MNALRRVAMIYLLLLSLDMRNEVSTEYAKCLPVAFSGRAGTLVQLRGWAGELRHAANSRRDHTVPICVALVWGVIAEAAGERCLDSSMW